MHLFSCISRLQFVINQLTGYLHLPIVRFLNSTNPQNLIILLYLLQIFLISIYWNRNVSGDADSVCMNDNEMD